MGVADYIILAVIAVCVIAAAVFSVRKKTMSCGGECSGCYGCHKKQKNREK